MTANLLTLITLPKRNFCSSVSNNNSLKFTTAQSIPLIQLGTLVSSLTVISLSLTKYHLSLSLVIISFVNFVVSAPILTSKLSVPLPRLLFTLSLITATLCTTTFKNLKQIVFRLFRTLLRGPWLRLPNSVISPLFSNLYIGLKSMNALNTNLFLLPVKLLPLLNISAQPDLCSAPSCYSLLICRHPFSTTYIFFSKNHQSLISLCYTSSLESTSCFIPSALHKTPC